MALVTGLRSIVPGTEMYTRVYKTLPAGTPLSLSLSYARMLPMVLLMKTFLFT